MTLAVELQREISKEIGAERLTSLDHRIAGLAPDGDLTASAIVGSGRSAVGRLLGRLGTLERLGLAAPVGSGCWQLARGWQERLAEIATRHDVIKRMHAALKADPAHYQILDEAATSHPFEGLVRRKGLHDELGGDFFAIVETPTGEAVYLRLDPATADRVDEGDLVRVSTERRAWSKPMDRVLEQVAVANGGVYDPGTHLGELASRRQHIAGREVSPHEILEANLRRLARLERFGLVRRLESGTWRVPADLCQQLADRERTEPRHRVRVDRQPLSLDQQKTQAGPTWLDTAASRPLALFGFGAALRNAADERDAFLRQHGIDPASPKRLTTLVELERRLADRSRGL